VGAGLSGVSETATVADLSFAAAGALGSCSDLLVTVTELIDPLGLSIDPLVTNGRICVVACADASGDGYVGVRDVLRVLFAFSGAPYEEALDLNASGAVDGVDLLIAARQFGVWCPASAGG
jgi:hypothetical protein